MDVIALAKAGIDEAVAPLGSPWRPPGGVAVLNAEDPLVAEMAEHCPGSVIYFARDAGYPIIAAHRATGGRAVVVHGEAAVASPAPQRHAPPAPQLLRHGMGGGMIIDHHHLRRPAPDTRRRHQLPNQPAGLFPQAIVDNHHGEMRTAESPSRLAKMVVKLWMGGRGNGALLRRQSQCHRVPSLERGGLEQADLVKCRV